MKIDDRKILRGGAQGDGLSAPRGSPGAVEPGEPIDAPTQVHELVRACGPVDLLRTDLVRRARAAMANGSHCVEPRAVARKLLRELLGELVS